MFCSSVSLLVWCSRGDPVICVYTASVGCSGYPDSRAPGDKPKQPLLTPLEPQNSSLY